MSILKSLGLLTLATASIGVISFLSLNNLHNKMNDPNFIKYQIKENERSRNPERTPNPSPENDIDTKQNPKPKRKPRKSRVHTAIVRTRQSSKSPSTKKTRTIRKVNPAPKKPLSQMKRSDMDFPNSPVVYWATVRAIFLRKMERESKESHADFLDRVFDSYAKEGYSRKDALGKAYGIAGFTLQKRGLIKSGTKEATKKGDAWGTKYIHDLGLEEVARRFKEYEKILKLAK